MEAKEQAKDLFNKMYFVDDVMGNYPMCFDTAKKCSIIAVEEIIKVTHSDKRANSPLDKEYWIKVKNELIKYKQKTPE
jgi:hypothetical protein